MKKKLWKFILEGFLIWALAVPALELLLGFSDIGIQRLFLFLYFSAFFFTSLLLTVMDKQGWIFRLLPVLPVTVLIISWDPELLWNCLFAMAVFVAATLIAEAEKRKWILPAPLLIYLILWIPREGMPAYAGGCLVLLLAAVISEFLKGERRSLWIVLLGAAAFLACLIPSDEEPMKWEGLKAVIAHVGEKVSTGWKNVSYFFEGLFGGEDTAYTGYGENSGLYGGISGSDKEELWFEHNGRQQPMYLTGARFVTVGQEGFTERDLKQQELPVNAWFAMYLNALAQAEVSHEEAVCFTRSEWGKVTYAYIRTSDLLLPATTFRIRRELKYGLTETEDKGFYYDFNLMSVDYGSRYFRKLCENVEGTVDTVDYSTAARTAKEIFGLNLSDFLSEEEYDICINACLEMEEDPAYRDDSMMTDRMRELTEKLTENCGTDMEKALAIEAFLRQYEYDQSTDLRGRENYVDSFLFEEQKGYCIHFASAMIVMLRGCGIPARLAQGYVFTPDEEGVVHGRNAHAWVEAYLHGIGWVRFEPTSSEESAEDYSWGVTLPSEAGRKDPEKSSEEMGNEGQTGMPEIPVPIINPAEIAAEERAESTTFLEILRTVGFYLLALVLLVGILTAGFLLIRWILYRRLTPENKLKHDVQQLEHKLDRRLPEGKKAESVFDYLPYVEEEVRGRLEELFRGYYRVRFRGDAADEQLVSGMRSIRRNIR